MKNYQPHLNKNNLKNLILLLLGVSLIASSCKKKEETDPRGKGSLKLRFDNVDKNENVLAFNTKYATNSADTFLLTELKYYLSNFALEKEDGSMEVLPKDYFLINQKEVSSKVREIKDIVFGEYTSMVFYIGVDSVANSSTNKTGDLDPDNEMAWNWNSGYKFIKVEGKVKLDTDSTSTYKSVVNHAGMKPNYVMVKIDLSGDSENPTHHHRVSENFENIKIQANKTTEIHIALDWSTIMDNYGGGMNHGGASADVTVTKMAHTFKIHHSSMY